MKTTSMFGGVQIFYILIMIIRAKVVAILLGPNGMGIMGLLNSTIGIIGSLTNFGLSTSAVKDIAAANGSNDSYQISRTITVFRRVVWVTGTLGTMLALILAPWLSQLTFGNREYTLAFVWLSITLLFSQLSSGQLVVLQGLQKLKLLAKANVYGSAIGLLVTLPLYYKFGTSGIVPGIIGTSLISLLLSWFYTRKIKFETVAVSLIQTSIDSKSMLKMGLVISLNTLLGAGTAYLIRIYIGRIGSLADVGLYSAGFMLLNTYFGLILNAMGTDYYPKLSKVAHNSERMNQTVNETAEISFLVMAPILITFLVFIKWTITLLLSRDFMPINGMIYWAALGMFFKPASWAIGYMFLAKGDGKVFLVNEVITKMYELLFNLLAYHFAGLTGLGISFTITCVINLIQIYYVSKHKYSFSFQKVFQKLFANQLTLAILSFVAVFLFSQLYATIFGGIIIVLSIRYSYIELDKRIDIKSIILNLKTKLKYK